MQVVGRCGAYEYHAHADKEVLCGRGCLSRDSLLTPPSTVKCKVLTRMIGVRTEPALAVIVSSGGSRNLEITPDRGL